MYKTLNEVNPTGMVGDGLFSKIRSPTIIDNFDASQIDMMYYNSYGQRIISPLVDNLLGEASTLSAENVQLLADLVATRYSKKWERLYEVYSIEYNPIQNYNMSETEGEIVDTEQSTTGEVSNTLTTEAEVTTSETTTHDGSETIDRDTTDTETRTGTGTANTTNSVYGFNSATDVNSDKAVGSTTTTDSISRTGAEDVSTTNDYNDTTSGSTTNEISTTTAEESSQTNNTNQNRSRMLTRAGNIGVTTSQQMLQSELDLWNWDIFKTIFDDVNKILTLKIYN